MGRRRLGFAQLTIAAAFVLVLAACGDDDAAVTTAAPPETTTTEAPPETTTTAAPPETTTTAAPPAETTQPPTTSVVSDIGIQNFAFGPRTVTIPVGTTLTWTNNQAGVTHTTTSDEELWSQTLATGDSFSFTFDSAGTFRYFCQIHPTMTATITVGG